VARRDQIHQPIKLSKAAVPQETVPPAADSRAANKENQHQTMGKHFAPYQGSALQKSSFPLPVLLYTAIPHEKQLALDLLG